MSNLADRVKETTTTTGTGAVSLAGNVSGYQTVVAGHGNGSAVDYCIEHTTAAEWEIGEGVVTDASPDTLTRVTVWSSSNAGLLVNFSAGVKHVFCSPPAQKIPLLHLAQTFTAIQTFTADIRGGRVFVTPADFSLVNDAPWYGIGPSNLNYGGSVVQIGGWGGLNLQTGSARLVIRGDSNKIGIFTETPQTTLDIAGDVRVTGTSTAPTSGKYVRLSYDTVGDVGDLIAYDPAASFKKLQLRGSPVTVTGGSFGVGMDPTVQFELSGSVGQKASGTTWSNPSDARLKENVTDFTDGLDVLRKVRPVHYTLNGLAGTPKGQQGISVIAQEMVEAMPYTIEIYTAKLRPEDTDETELYRFEASAVTFALVNAVKELDARVQAMGG